MNPRNDFLSSLQPGDLVAATVRSSAKLHLIHVVRRVSADMVKGDPDEAHLARMIDGTPLCSARPRYWWTPTDALESWAAGEQCSACFGQWRSGGRPTIKGWAKAERPATVEHRLPWGWQAVAPQGHPHDLPKDAPDPEEDGDQERRVEVARYQRGNRYVRITQSHDDQRFCVRYGALDDGPKDECWAFKGGWDAALLRAVACMAMGGQWCGSASVGKLTLADVATKV